MRSTELADTPIPPQLQYVALLSERDAYTCQAANYGPPNDIRPAPILNLPSIALEAYYALAKVVNLDERAMKDHFYLPLLAPRLRVHTLRDPPPRRGPPKRTPPPRFAILAHDSESPFKLVGNLDVFSNQSNAQRLPSTVPVPSPPLPF